MRYIWVIGFLILSVMVLGAPGLNAQADERWGLKPYRDDAPGARTPVILLHGVNPDPENSYGWGAFLRYWETQPELRERYKLYFFVFDPAERIADNSRRFQDDLKALRDSGATPPYRLAALSLGGLVAYHAFEDPAVSGLVDRVVGLGVPFHGSPLANPGWIGRQIDEGRLLSVMRLAKRPAYWITRRKFPYFETDYCWDNFDGALPEALIRDCSLRMPHPGGPGWTLYAGFFGADPEHRVWLYQWLAAGEVPDSRMRSTRLGRHMLFPYVQHAIADLPLAGEVSYGYPSLMAFNDGISPLSSQFWLGRFFPLGEITVQSQWEQIRQLQGSGRYRLFDGLDHRDWLEGGGRYRTGEAIAPFQDLLHPDEPARSMFDWLIRDLLTG